MALFWKVPKDYNPDQTGLYKAEALALQKTCDEMVAKKTPKLKNFRDVVMYGDAAKVKIMLKSKPKLVFGKDKITRRTPLAFAVQEDRKDMVELLLDSGADVNAKDGEGHTPLQEAAFGGHIEIAELLVAKGADVNTMNDYGYTPLHHAALKGYKGMVELLLSYDAEVNALDNAAKTPMQWATEYGHKDVVELLLKHGGHE